MVLMSQGVAIAILIQKSMSYFSFIITNFYLHDHLLPPLGLKAGSWLSGGRLLEAAEGSDLKELFLDSMTSFFLSATSALPNVPSMESKHLSVIEMN